MFQAKMSNGPFYRAPLHIINS